MIKYLENDRVDVVIKLFFISYVTLLAHILNHFLCSFDVRALLVYGSASNVSLEDQTIRNKLISSNATMGEGLSLGPVYVNPVGK